MNLGAKLCRKAEIEWHAWKTRRQLQMEWSGHAGDPMLAYLHMGFPDAVPSREGMLSGGGVKYQYLNDVFPAQPSHCNLLYVVSSSRYHHTYDLLRWYKRRGVKIVWNQNGSYFPHFYGEHYARKMNRRMFREMQLADVVLFQSQFAKSATESLMGTFEGVSRILYNSIDTQRFVPVAPSETEIQKHHQVILMAGSHNDPYRLRLGVETLHVLHRAGDRHLRLKIAGNVLPHIQREVEHRIEQLKLGDFVHFLGPYAQAMAQNVYLQGDLLLHTKYMDVCPSMVLEAMACGLPVVYSKTGGTPELVGEEAGVGVCTRESLHEQFLPEPDALADAVREVLANRERFSKGARERVVRQFDLATWMDAHLQCFQELRS